MNYTRQIVVIVSVILVVIFSQTFVFAVCDDLYSYQDSEIETYFAILKDSTKEEINRLLVYNKLACSSNPLYRKHARDIGLQGTKSVLLRSQILMDAMMEREIFVIDLIDSTNLSKESQNYIKKNNGQIRLQAHNKDTSIGCITLYIHSACGDGREIKISGQIVELNFSPHKLYGKFKLTPDNELVGNIVSGSFKTGKIPAKMQIFQ